MTPLLRNAVPLRGVPRPGADIELCHALLERGYLVLGAP